MLSMLVYAVFLLVGMPALLLGVGAFVKRVLEKRPSFIGFPVEREQLIAEQRAAEAAAALPQDG